MILTFSPNPTLERVALVESFQTGRVPLDEFQRKSLEKPMRVMTWAGGGGLRQATVARLLGANVLALGCVGGPLGQLLRDALDRQDVPHVLTPTLASTRGSFLTLDKERGVISEIREEPPILTDAEAESLLRTLERHLDMARLLIVADGEEGNAPELFAAAIQTAKAKNVPVIADLTGAALDAAVQAGVFLVRVKLSVLQRQTERSLFHDSGIVQEANAIRAQGVENVIVTLGEEGALLVNANGTWRVKAPVVSHFNPTGSGETLSAAFAVQYLATEDVVDATRYGCAAASVNVTHDEPGYATPGEIGVLFPRTLAGPVDIR